ncbi:MAG: penicillin-binding protein 2 [Candidatus Berkelbacteria bacterium]
MSIFDRFDKSLPGDRGYRRVELDKDEYELFPAEQEIFSREEKHFWSFYLAIFLVFLCLGIQLLNLQIKQGSFNRFLAEGNRIRTRLIPAPRGLIYDNTGKPLVLNDASFSLQVYPVDLPRQTSERQAFYDHLSQITQIPSDEIKAKINEKGPYSTNAVILKEKLDRDTALLLQTQIVDLSGVVVAAQPVRQYSTIGGLSPVIGYTGRVTDSDLKNNQDITLTLDQMIGKDGLEKIYQSYLKGKDGINEIEVDSRGRAQRLLTSLSPEPGNNLVLSLNADLEQAISETMASEIEKTGSSAGAAVAVNPQTGEILALVSLPSYDNNVFAQGISAEDYQKILKDKNLPLFNRAISGEYPSGSTVKPIVAAAGLQEGVITENTTLDCPAEIKVGSWTFPDWKYHGLTDVKKAIAESVNIYFYAVGGGYDKIKGIGPDKLKAYYEKFGLGAKSGIDLPGEAKGLVPDPAWKKKTKNEMWYLGDTYHMSIGQGDVLTTPLQMAMATATVANGGNLLKPHLVSKITDNNGNTIQTFPNVVTRSNVVDANNLRIVRDGMRQTVTSGSGQALKDLSVEVAAKTGTAQFGDQDKTHAWMVAFAPYKNPQIAIAVIVEGGGEGYAAAGPVIKSAMKSYFSEE